MNENFYVLTLPEIKQIVHSVSTQLHFTFTEIALNDDVVRKLPYYVHWEDDGHTATVTVKARTPHDINVVYHTIRDHLNQSNFTIVTVRQDYNYRNGTYIKTFKIKNFTSN